MDVAYSTVQQQFDETVSQYKHTCQSRRISRWAPGGANTT